MAAVRYKSHRLLRRQTGSQQRQRPFWLLSHRGRAFLVVRVVSWSRGFGGSRAAMLAELPTVNLGLLVLNQSFGSRFVIVWSLEEGTYEA